MFFKIKQKILEYKYKKAKPIYIICLWAKYGFLECKFANKYNKEGELLTIQWTDNNGEHEEYYIAPWHYESTGAISWTFDKDKAKEIVERMNERY